MAFHEELRNHRLKKGLILEEISEETKINVRILQALEQGNFHILPIPYVRLFMKAYAQAIDYPVEDIIRGLENELQLTGDQIVPPMPTSLEGDGSPPQSDIDERLAKSISINKSSQNSMFRLAIGIVLVVIIIVFGRNVLQPGAETEEAPAPLLPAINYTQVLDSLRLDATGDPGNPSELAINAGGFLTLVVSRADTPADTQFLQLNDNRNFILSDSIEISLFPSENATLSIETDTLPTSPFNNSWMVISVEESGTVLNTYSSY